MNVAEYLAQKGVDCTFVETSVLRDKTAKFLGSDYEGTMKVLGVPVAITTKDGLESVKLQLFYVRGWDGTATDGSPVFDGTETVQPIVSDDKDYTETEAELFTEDVKSFLDGYISASILKYNIDTLDADDEFAIVTVYMFADGAVTPTRYFVYRYNNGAFSFYPYGA